MSRLFNYMSTDHVKLYMCFKSPHYISIWELLVNPTLPATVLLRENSCKNLSPSLRFSHKSSVRWLKKKKADANNSDFRF